MWKRRDLLKSVAALGLPAALSGRGHSQDAPVRSTERAGIELITPATRKAIERGLSFLAKSQVTNGSFRGAFGAGGYACGVAVCGLSGLAFLGSGSTPGRGPHGKHVERCVDYLTSNMDSNGYISTRGNGGQDVMYGHGFATLFLAEAYGMASRVDVNDELGNRLRSAVDLIVKTQNDEGGWRYQPVKSDADLSITICQIMALRAARDAGLHVPEPTRKKCIDYVRKSHLPNGSFCYTPGSGNGSFALASAGVVALNSAGIYDGEDVESGLKFIWARKPNGLVDDGYFFYAQYYAAQAMWHAGGDYWTGWYTAIRDTLVKLQGVNGSWIDPGIGQEFGTAMALIILQLPYNYVPVFSEG